MYKKKLGQTYYTNRHSCFLLQYHIVLVTKYRRPVLTGAVKELIYQVIQDIFDEKDYARTQYGDTILKKSCQDSLFWSNSYFTTIANENSLQLIQEYIKNQ